MGIVAIGNILIKLMGFFREVLLSNKFGASPETDAYLTSYVIPLILFQFLGVGYATAIIKTLSQLENENENQSEFINKLFSFTLLISVILLIIFYIFSTEIIRVFAPGLNKETVDLASNLLEISLPMVISSMVIAITSGILQYTNNFVTDIWSNLPNNLIIIVFILFFTNQFGIYGVTYSSVFGSLTVLLIHFYKISKEGYSFKLSFKFDKKLLTFLKVLIPVTFFSMMQMIGTLVNRFIASFMEEGSISILYFADRLYNLPYLIIVLAITTTLFPKLVSVYNSNEIVKFKKYINNLFKIITLLLTPVVIIMFTLKREIVEIVYMRGSFSENDVTITALCFAAYTLGILSLGIRELFIKVFICIGKSTPLFINTVYMFLINVILGFILSNVYGVVGLAISTSIAFLISSIYLYIKLKSLNYISISRKFAFKYIVIFTLLSFIIHFIYNYIKNINPSNIITLFLVSLITIILYILLLYYSKIVPRKIITLKKR